MARKRYNPEDLDETVGPMNNVASEDARAWAHVDESRPLDKHKEREVRAKKQKIKKSTTKTGRRLNKQIIKNWNPDE